MFEQRQTTFETSGECELEIAALSHLPLTTLAPVASPINKGFEFPRRVWLGMLACYAVFFTAIFAATGGGGYAAFSIAISVAYTVIYFGVARIAARQAGPEDTSPLDRGQPLQTWTGPMDSTAVYAQVLVVPAAVAAFGLGILTITVLV